MIFDLEKTGINVVGMNNDVIMGIGYSEVVCADKHVLPDRAELAVEFGTIGCEGHVVDWDRVPRVLSGSVKYLSILLSWFGEDMLWHD